MVLVLILVFAFVYPFFLKVILSWFNHADGVCSRSYNEVSDISRLQYIACSIFMQDYTCEFLN